MSGRVSSSHRRAIVRGIRRRVLANFVGLVAVSVMAHRWVSRAVGLEVSR